MTPALRCTATVLALATTLSAAVGDEPRPFPDMAPSIGVLLDKHYYDAKRIRPRVMVERALRALENAEFLIDTTWADDRIVFNYKGARRTIDAAEPIDLAGAMRLIEEVRRAIDTTDLSARTRRDLAYAMIEMALLTLDPHSGLIPATANEEQMQDLRGEFFGIGAYLSEKEGSVAIERVMPGLPAERAGIEDGDVILAIDGERTAGLSLGQAVSRIKGPRGTSVTLTLQRKSRQAPFDLAITRDLVKVIKTKGWRAQDVKPDGTQTFGNVGYVRMDDFSTNTAGDLWNALRELEREHPLKALVLDLRGNPGGLLPSAKVIASLFLRAGDEIVRTAEIDGTQETEFNRAVNRNALPLAVLVSPGSASAAEIISGAFQLNNRAVIIGSSTFGKGTVQTLRDLVDGSSLKMTIQEYLLPGGVSIQNTGVVPDIALRRRWISEQGKVHLTADVWRGEREGEREFTIPNTRPYANQSACTLAWVQPFEGREERRRYDINEREFRPDREAQMVIDLLERTAADEAFAEAAAAALEAGRMRQFLIERLRPLVMERAEVESQVLAAALARQDRPVTWGGPEVAQPGQLTIACTDPGRVAAFQTKGLDLTIANTADRDLGRLYAVVVADDGSPFDGEEVAIGTVPAKSSATAVLLVQIPPRWHTGEERFRIELRQDGSDTALASCAVRLGIDELPRPALGCTWRLEEPGGGDGIVAPDEQVRLRVELRNDGEAEVKRKPLVRVWKDNDPYVNLQASPIDVDGDFKPGETRVFTIPFQVKREIRRRDRVEPFAGTSIKLFLNAQETFDEKPIAWSSAFAARLNAPLVVPVNRPVRERRLSRPIIDWKGVAEDDAGRTRLQFEIRDAGDDPKVPALSFVALFQGEDKLDLQPATALEGPAKGDGVWRYRPRVTLKPGLNSLALRVRDADDLEDVRLLRIWKDAP